MGRMRNPSLSIHGIEGAFSAPGSKTVIPASVAGKFSIRLVPNLGINNTTECVYKYINEEFKKLGSKNKCEVELTHGGEPWIVSAMNWTVKMDESADTFRPTPTTTRTARPTRPPSRSTARSPTTPARAVPSPSPSTLPTFSASTFSSSPSAAVTTVPTRPTRRLTPPTTSTAPSSSARTSTSLPPSARTKYLWRGINRMSWAICVS